MTVRSELRRPSHRRGRLGVAALVVVALVGALPAVAAASYPGRAGALVYQLQSQWAAGNLGSCDGCFGGLSGIFRLEPNRHPEPFDACLFAGQPQPRCASGAPVVECVWGSGGVDMCVPLHPSFAADGRRLVFTQSGVGTCTYDNGCEPAADAPHTIVLADATGGGRVALPPLTASDDEPAFLPSGNSLVFAGRPEAVPRSPQQLYEVRVDGSGLTQLTTNGGSQPAPCANGSLAFVHAGDVYLRSADGRRVRRLTDRGGQRPDCAPDSRTVAFVHAADVYIVSTRGGPARRVTRSRRVRSGPVFSPTGRRLAFATTTVSPGGDTCIPRITAVDDLVEVDLHGRSVAPPRLIATGAVDDPDCGGHGSAPGALAWQPLGSPQAAPGPAAARSRST